MGVEMVAPERGWRDRPDHVAGRLRVSEIDQPAAQAWKRRRLSDLGYRTPGFAAGSTLAMTFLLPTAEHVSGRTIGERYFAGRTDGLRPSTGEDFLLAGT